MASSWMMTAANYVRLTLHLDDIFCRYAYGIKTVPEVFQKRSSVIFGNIRHVHVTYDDIIIAAEDENEHDDILQILLQARKSNNRFNLKKLQLKVSSVKYLGFIESANGIIQDKNMVKAKNEMPTLADEAALKKRFLGINKYLSKFIDNFSDKTLPFRQLLQRDVPLTWTASLQYACDGFKRDVTITPVLRFSNQSKPVVIQTDASSIGIGSVLLQDKLPIAYASRTV